MERSVDHFSIDPPKPTIGERIGKLFQGYGRMYSPETEFKPSAMERARLALGQAGRAGAETFPWARHLIVAGDSFKEASDWRNAGACYEQAYLFYLDVYPVHNCHEVLEAIIHTGQGFERALRQAGEDAAAQEVHAELERVTGMEFDIPIAVRMVEPDGPSR